MSTTVDQLLSQCSISLTEEEGGAFRIYAPDRLVADALKQLYQQLAAEALKLGKACTEILWPACRFPYKIPATMAMAGIPGDDVQPQQPQKSEEILMPGPREINLLGFDYCAMHEFLAAQRKEGKIVIITSNKTGICYHTNDLLRPERGVLQPLQWNGYNYLRSWRRSLHDWENLNPQLERLQELLARDGQVLDYDYTLYRPDDAHCRYSTSYYLCNDYMGDQVRVGISRPEDWELLTPSETAIAT